MKGAMRVIAPFFYLFTKRFYKNISQRGIMLIKIIVSIILWVVSCCISGLFNCYMERNYNLNIKREFVDGFMRAVIVSGAVVVFVGIGIALIALWK